MLYTDLTPVAVHDVARALDERGFESLWFGEHTHLPVGSNYPEEEAAAGLARLCDPLVLLSTVAAVTSKLRLGTVVCRAAEHEPLGLAHAIATLDMISNGRVEFGIGYGHNAREMRNRGLDVANRRAILREKVLAMKALWTQEVASYHGRYVQFADSWSWPKPAQQPHPPIHLGVHGPVGLGHVVEMCDGWIPDLVSQPVERMLELKLGLFARAESAGRDPRSITITALVLPTSPSSGMTNPLWRPDPEEFRRHALTRRDLEHYASLGVDRIVVLLDFRDARSVGPILDHIAEQIPT
jgi:probable F420-dependent oxidoreductase